MCLPTVDLKILIICRISLIQVDDLIYAAQESIPQPIMKLLGSRAISTDPGGNNNIRMLITA